MNTRSQHRQAHRSGMPAEHPALVPTGTWSIDPDRSTLSFRVRHMRLATVRGRFHRFSGGIDNPSGGETHAAGAAEVGSIDTGEPIRDEQLRSQRFFDVERYPQIRFEAHSIEEADGGFAVTGTLTIKDAARPITLAATSEPLDEARAVRIRAEGALSRRDFELDWPGLLDAGRIVVGDRIEIELDLVATEGPRLRPVAAARERKASA